MVTYLREYTILHECIEMDFESDLDKFDINRLMDQLGILLGAYEQNFL